MKPAPSAQSLSRRPTVLVLDDSEIVLAALGSRLEAAGCDVVSVKSVAELEERGHPTDADLILLDLHLPELYGDDIGMVLRRVRGVKSPIWLMSHERTPDVVKRAAEAGLDGYVRKDMGMDAIVTQVMRGLAAHGRAPA
jgi:DNA-binding response OmpR family regulator